MSQNEATVFDWLDLQSVESVGTFFVCLNAILSQTHMLTIFDEVFLKELEKSQSWQVAEENWQRWFNQNPAR